METKTIVVPVGQDGLRNRALYVAQLALKLQRNRIDLFDLRRDDRQESERIRTNQKESERIRTNQKESDTS
jgi:hypothetical protein